MKSKIFILLSMLFANCLTATPTPSEVNAILSKYANNPKGWSALNYAIDQGDITSAIILVDYVRDFNKIDGSQNPLSRIFLRAALSRRKLSDEEKVLIEKILEKGPNLKWEKAGDQATFSNAVYAGDKDIVLKLLDKGADIDEAKGAPIRMAISHKHYSILKLLISKGAKIDHPDGHSPLFTAIAIKDIKIIKLLLKNNANPNAINTNGRSVLEETLVMNFPEKDTIIDLLIQHGAKVL